MTIRRLGFVLMIALAAAATWAAPAPPFRPNRYADREALLLLKRDLAEQRLELVDFEQEGDFWVATVLDHKARPSKRWQYVIGRSQAPSRTAAFDAVRSRFIVPDSKDTVEPD